MIQFKATLLKFDKKCEKTGWTYVEVPEEIIRKLKPGMKKSFRVKGKLDNYTLSKVALIPMGEGDFILPINGEMRKAIKKQKDDVVVLKLEEDTAELTLSEDMLICLKDDKEAKKYFESLPKSHQHYYSKWIESAKTPETKAKRIAQCLHAFANKMDYGEMMRYNREKKEIM
ncbi:MAG: YdeI/OmpD-associated family protein [Bacteroidota bacterium]|nr:YdeI/OmpD-associated family protein [Bacteroidota bacterium]